MANLPGVDVSVDWERVYVNDGLFRSVLGNVSNSDEGLPSERLDYYLVRDYSEMIGLEKVISSSNMKMYFMVQKVSVADKQGTTIRTETISEERAVELNFNNRYGITEKVEESIEKY